VTELEWSMTKSPKEMLLFLQQRSTERKLRLFVVACAYLIWDRLVDDRLRAAVEVAERYADDLSTTDELLSSCRTLIDIPIDYSKLHNQNWFTIASADAVAAYYIVLTAIGHWRSLAKLPDYWYWDKCERLVGFQQPRLIRDVFGNPFQPIAINPNWRTPAVVTLAEYIYHDRAFDRMHELAKLLEEGACDNTDVLNHCRSEGMHVRGCWVIDLLLGKE
jgi:hypothetical protein